MRPGDPARQTGFTYVTLLFAIAVFGVGLAAIGQTASDAAHRDREAELIRSGKAVMHAIRSYYYASPGTQRALPKTWDDLLDDKRFVAVRRHLRRIPLDPFSNSTNWGEIRDPDGGLSGIYSRSTRESFRRTDIRDGQQVIATGPRYVDWKFQFVAAAEKP